MGQHRLLLFGYWVCEQTQVMAPSGNVPTILFQVYGVGLMDRCVLEGYGYAHLPDQVRSYKLARLWTRLCH
jgi:hypothetical protein